MTIPLLPTLVIRHRKENLKKCSLTGLEPREDFTFFRYPLNNLSAELNTYCLLGMEGEPLTAEDRHLGLLLVDGTWRYAQKMEKWVLEQCPQITRRTLSGNWRTAYPRCQSCCPDPERGLASVEALYAAYNILGYSTEGLLDHYHWKERFLELSQGKRLAPPSNFE